MQTISINLSLGLNAFRFQFQNSTYFCRVKNYEMSVKVVATLIMASLTIANKTPSLSDDKRAEIRFTENYYEEIGCTKIPNSDPIA